MSQAGAPALVFSHFGFYGADYHRLVEFYTRVMGFAVSDHGAAGGGPMSLCFMTRRPFEHHQLVVVSGRDPAHPSTINQIAFLAPDLGELRRLRDRVAAEPGVSAIATADHGVTWTLYFRDPGGNRVSVSVETGWWVPQPSLAPLDLDRPDDEIRTQTEARCRATEGFTTRAAWREQTRAALAESGGLMPQATPSVDADETGAVFRRNIGDRAAAGAFPRIAQSHIGLYATDLDELAGFYRDKLGYLVTGQGRMGPIGEEPASDYVYLTRDPDQFAQIILCAGRPAGVPSSVNQLTFRVPTIGALRAIDRVMTADKRVTQFRYVNHGNSFSIYCNDPEGNALELSRESEWYVPAPSAWPLDLSLSDEELLRTTEAKCREYDEFMMRADWKARARAELIAAGRLEAEEVFAHPG